MHVILCFIASSLLTFFSTCFIPKSHAFVPSYHGSTSMRHMFTGIVEEIGSVVDLVELNDIKLYDGSIGKGVHLTVRGDIVLVGAYVGCSINVSGVCLTVTQLNNRVFKTTLAPETMRRTHLHTLIPGSNVNLERAISLGSRISGHFVQGHVDGVGIIIDRRMDGDSLFYKVTVDEDILKFIVPKGFVSVDGTSLTVCEVDRQDNWFTFMLVEYTQTHIVIPSKDVGGMLNIEVDVMGKYAESALNAVFPRIRQLEDKVKGLEKKLVKMKNDS